MMVQAGLIAYNNYSKPICNPHNDTKSELAPILWLFYVSKVSIPRNVKSTEL